MERSKQIVKTSVIGIAVNLVLVAFKMAVGLLSGSIAVILDGVNNLTDSLSSLITIAGTRLADRAPDKAHPYGYGRIEYVSSITVAVIILLAGLTAFREAFDKTLHPTPANYSAASLVIIAVAVGAKLALGRYVKAAGERYHSQALAASGADALMDAAISLSTLVAAGVSIAFSVSIEGVLGVVISVFILKAGVEILLDSLNSIIGARVDSSLSAELKKFICKYPPVLGAYDLSLHQYGPERLIGSVHIELPDDMTAREIHGLTRQMTEDVYKTFGIVLTVGIYASNTAGEVFAGMKRALSDLVREYPQVLQMHGFYVDTEKKLVYFDLIIDFKAEDKEKIKDDIIRRMKERFGEYTFIAVLDGDVSE